MNGDFTSSHCTCNRILLPIRPKYTMLCCVAHCILVHSAISQDTLTSIPRYWPIRMNIFPISRFHNPQIYHKMQCIWLHLGAFYNIPRHLAWSPQYGPTPWGPGLAHIFVVFVFRIWYLGISFLVPDLIKVISQCPFCGPFEIEVQV